MILEFELQYLNGQNLNSYSKVEIKDANGNVIKTITYDEAKGWYNPISLSLPQGVYTINLYSGSNLIESRSIGLKDGKLVSQTKVLAATGWGSVFDPKISVSGGCTGNKCQFNMTVDANGGTKYAIVAANGQVIQTAGIPVTGTFSINTSQYLEPNTVYYLITYAKDANGNEIEASVQKLTTNEKGSPTYEEFK